MAPSSKDEAFLLFFSFSFLFFPLVEYCLFAGVDWGAVGLGLNYSDHYARVVVVAGGGMYFFFERHLGGSPFVSFYLIPFFAAFVVDPFFFPSGVVGLMCV
jgi:hypothetical protein